ncbi:MAG: DUF1573 domain-containing protein [Mangrovibacterium sp.]
MHKLNRNINLGILIISFIFLSACESGNSKKSKTENLVNNGKGKVEFLNEMHNFGKLEAGEQISFSFKFKNLGDGIASIDSITSDCGCMEISFPKEDILPKEDNYVDVLFNSAGEFGRVFKQVKVFSCGKNEPITLTLVAEVDNPLFD